MNCNRRTFAACIAAFLTAVAVPVAGPIAMLPVAAADEMDDLVANLDKVSKDVESMTEQVKQLEIDIQNKEADVRRAAAAADRARTNAVIAADAVQRARIALDRVAQTKYRGSNTDELTTIIAGDSPQNAIDRNAYIEALTRSSGKAVLEYKDAVKAAADASDKAARAEAAAVFEENQLKKQKSELEANRADLSKRQDEIRKQIDKLDLDQKIRWAAKNNPVDYHIEDIIGFNPSGWAALQAAYTKLGAPYSWGATGPNAFDCSGLVVWAYRQQGKILPRTSQAQMRGGIPVPRNMLQPGDVIGFYGGASHVGLYAGNGMVLHASDYGIPVQVVPLNSMPFYGARRY